jgi:hypothetical protein
MNPTKIFGWLFLIGGILLIAYSLFSSYNIFTGKSPAPEIFKVEEKTEMVLPQKEKAGDLAAQAEKTAGEEFQKQFQKMIPAGSVPQLLNLISWSILAGILIFGGAQISGLGIGLIKVKEYEKNIPR